MAKNVKFIRLGYDVAVDSSEYRSFQQPGNIIFARVNSGNGEWYVDSCTYVPPAHYIWANGIEYKVADADALTYALEHIEQLEFDVSILNGDDTVEGSVSKAIKDALEAYRPKAEHIAALVDTETSNVAVDVINDTSLTVYCEQAETQSDITIAQNVGYLKAGAVIPGGTAVEDLIRMIFTKVLGLNGCNNPSASISGISTQTLEVGTEINNVKVTAGFNDGSWKNEDKWLKDGKDTQPYGCTVQTYTFTGMVTQEASESKTATINNYTIAEGAQKVTVQIAHTGSANIPVNQNGAPLQEGTVNDTLHYKPQSAGTVSQTTNIITGDYKYWIGYTAIKGDTIQRADILDPAKFTIINQGFVGNGFTYAPQYNTPTGNYVTIIVPSTMKLKHVEDSFNNDVTDNFSRYEKDGHEISLSHGKLYYVYQEYAQAGAGLERKNIQIVKNS